MRCRLEARLRSINANSPIWASDMPTCATGIPDFSYNIHQRYKGTNITKERFLKFFS
jgi:hypothetical protein